ncbi:MAG: hypothetical protein EXS05_20070 [Planctomycetaceae bacterium]|nr:hypothetical protein [Planctomycetaceae bacterium]
MRFKTDENLPPSVTDFLSAHDVMTVYGSSMSIASGFSTSATSTLALRFSKCQFNDESFRLTHAVPVIRPLHSSSIKAMKGAAKVLLAEPYRSP